MINMRQHKRILKYIGVLATALVALVGVERGGEGGGLSAQGSARHLLKVDAVTPRGLG
jgi:hypothetical protein